MSYESLIIGGSVSFCGLYIYHEIYEKTRPIIEGKIIDANFTNKDNSRIKVQTENGDLELIIDTKEFKYGPLMNIGCGFDYKGRADELAAFLSVGDQVRARVEERKGLERSVYELLDVYLEPFRESKIIFIPDFFYNLIRCFRDRKINKSKSIKNRGMNVNTLEAILRKSWGEDTCYPLCADEWSSDNPALGQCAVTALVVQDYLGGTIVYAKAKLPDGDETSHYFNIINGQEYDLTRDQFPEGTVIPEGLPRTFEFPTVRNFLLSNEKTEKRYKILKQRVQSF